MKPTSFAPKGWHLRVSSCTICSPKLLCCRSLPMSRRLTGGDNDRDTPPTETRRNPWHPIMTLKNRKTPYGFRGAAPSSGPGKLLPVFPWLGLALASWGPSPSMPWQRVNQVRPLLSPISLTASHVHPMGRFVVEVALLIPTVNLAGTPRSRTTTVAAVFSPDSNVPPTLAAPGVSPLAPRIASRRHPTPLGERVLPKEKGQEGQGHTRPTFSLEFLLFEHWSHRTSARCSCAVSSGRLVT